MQAWEPNVEALVEALKHSRYSISTRCDLWEIFENLNNWNIIHLMPWDDNNEDKVKNYS
jgi:hypothetical protein